MRRLLRDIADGNELGDVSTLRYADVVEQLEAKVSEPQNGAADSPRGSGRAGAPQRSAGVRPRR